MWSYFPAVLRHFFGGSLLSAFFDATLGFRISVDCGCIRSPASFAMV